MISLLFAVALAQATQDDAVLQKADRIFEEAKALYESARDKSSVPGFVEAEFKLEEARIKYLVLQEIGQGDKPQIAADRLRALIQLGKLIRDSKVAITGAFVDKAPPAKKPESPPDPTAPPPPPPAPPVDVSKRAPVPDPAKQKEAEKAVRDLFKDQYALKGIAERRGFVRKLLEQASQNASDPVAQWVLYREARDVAVQCADVRAALESVELTARVFDVEPLAMKVQTLAASDKAARVPADFLELARAQDALVDDLVRVDQYDAAVRTASAAQANARKSNDPAFAAKMAVRSKDVGEAKTLFDGLKRTLEALARNSDDPAGNAEMGKYLCYAKGNWELGLRFMVKGSDAALKALAEKEMAALGKSTADQLAAADGWYELGEKEKSTLRRIQILRHAAELYEAASMDATGLNRARIDKRLESIDQVLNPGGGGSVDLSTLKPIRTSFEVGQLETFVEGKPSKVVVGGKPCKSYLFAHGPSSLTYELPAGSRRFVATGVKADPTEPKSAGSWKYQVFVDGKLLLETRPLSESKTGEVEISVRLPAGAKEITLTVDILGNRDYDWAVWANARVLK